MALKLNGHTKWLIKEEENKIKQEYKIDFYKKDNRKRRDDILKDKKCGFLDIIYGHRGTLNYRESMYPIYDISNYNKYNNDISNYYITAYKFFEMACVYFKKKVGEKLWQEIRTDIYKQCSIVDEEFIIK